MIGYFIISKSLSNYDDWVRRHRHVISIHNSISSLSRPPPTLWERIQSYKSGYVEKTVLLNSEVADQIVQSIVTHTRGNQDTVFLDGEGALCHIGATLKQMNTFGSVKVLEKDMELRSLHKYAKERYLDEVIPIVPLNLNQMVADKFASGSLYESPLIEHIPSTSTQIGKCFMVVIFFIFRLRFRRRAIVQSGLNNFPRDNKASD